PFVGQGPAAAHEHYREQVMIDIVLPYSGDASPTSSRTPGADQRRRGLLLLHRSGLSPHTPCRFLQAHSLTLPPAGLLSRLKRRWSRRSDPSGYPTEPLVSFQINQQLSGWIPAPLVIRAFGAHCQ